METVRSVWGARIDGYPSYILTQKLLLLKNCVRVRYGKENHVIEVQRAQEQLLDIQRILHDQPDNEELPTSEHQASLTLQQLRKELESTMRQKAKMKWIQLGDNNTRLIH